MFIRQLQNLLKLCFLYNYSQLFEINNTVLVFFVPLYNLESILFLILITFSFLPTYFNCTIVHFLLFFCSTALVHILLTIFYHLFSFIYLEIFYNCYGSTINVINIQIKVFNVFMLEFTNLYNYYYVGLDFIQTYNNRSWPLLAVL